MVSALRATVTFERSVLVVLEDGDATRVLSLERAGESPDSETGTRGDWSPRLWPAEGSGPTVIGDARTELDGTHAADRALIERDERAVLAAPLGEATRPLGLLLLTSRTPHAFTAADAERLRPLLDLTGFSLANARLWSVERERQQRQAKLAALLPAIAHTLDVRQSFLQLAAAVKDVVPHDILAFALVAPDGASARVQAATHKGLLELPEYRYSNRDEAMGTEWDFLLAFDLEPLPDGTMRVRIPPRDGPVTGEVIVDPGPAWVRFLTEARVRSILRVPIRVKERRMGGIAFFSRAPFAYDEEDAALGARIADHVALALAYQEMADEERRVAQAEARAQVLELRVTQLSEELQRFTAHRALGVSAPWKQALADATRVAATDTTVLITGESGTGKEVLAQFIHRGSARSRGPFVALNCAALPAELIESELFGHERGAFTGAVAARAGRIEQAAGGVLFLDEVGEMPPNAQAKLLRVLQEREFQRLGGTRTIKAEVRIVAATNRDPKRAVASGLLREDLYYRLGVFEIHLPPLRERPEDILVLAQGFLEEIGASFGRPVPGISEDAAALLAGYGWPGNVRELRNAIERALILCHGGLITREHLPGALVPAPVTSIAETGAAEAGFPAGGVQLDDVERDLVVRALAEAGGNKSAAAKLLGLPRGRLYSLMRRYQLTEARR